MVRFRGRDQHSVIEMLGETIVTVLPGDVAHAAQQLKDPRFRHAQPLTAWLILS
jgi:hypothetical protein